MSRLSARAYCRVVVTIVACIFLSDDGMTAEDRSVDSLRDRVKVLAQARDKAAAELGLKEQQGIATSRDREHFITVAEFLEQQIADSCIQLVEKGGAAVSADLPCPSQAMKGETGQQNNDRNSPAEETSAHIAANQQQKASEPEEEKEDFPVNVQPARPSPAETAPAQKKVEGVKPHPQQPPETGFFAALRRWWESLFAPKPPPASSSGESSPTAEQKEKTTAGNRDAQSRDDSASQQTGEHSAAVQEGATATNGNRQQSGKRTVADKAVPGKSGADPEQGQLQQQNGMKQVATGAEQSGQEPDVENSARGMEAAGVEEKRPGETAEAAGTGSISGKKSVDAGHTTAINKTGTGLQDVAQGAAAGSGHEAGRGISAPETGERKSATAGSGTKEQVTGHRPGTGQQKSVQPAGRATAETGKQQSGSVASRTSEKKETDQVRQQGSTSAKVTDKEVARLEQTLQDALGEFDGTLLSEQERLATRIPKQREGSVGSSSGYGAEGVPGSGGSGGISAGGYGSPDGERGDGRAGSGGTRQPGSVASGDGKAAPAEGQATLDTDDDIVARQLREAAENETDPELREKLWQEYRKYKQGAGKR